MKLATEDNRETSCGQIHLLSWLVLPESSACAITILRSPVTIFSYRGIYFTSICIPFLGWFLYVAEQIGNPESSFLDYPCLSWWITGNSTLKYDTITFFRSPLNTALSSWGHCWPLTTWAGWHIRDVLSSNPDGNRLNTHGTHIKSQCTIFLAIMPCGRFDRTALHSQRCEIVVGILDRLCKCASALRQTQMWRRVVWFSLLLEDRCSTFLWDVAKLVPNYVTSHSRWYYFMTPSIWLTTQRPVLSWLVNNEFKGIWIQVAVASSRHYPGGTDATQ